MNKTQEEHLCRDIRRIAQGIERIARAVEKPEVIRCRDCKHSRFFDPCFYCYEMGGEIIVPENGFCFKAERKINDGYRNAEKRSNM